MSKIKIIKQDRTHWLDIVKLKNTFKYDPLTGSLTRNGKQAGSVKRNKNGVWFRVCFDRECYTASKLVWVIMTGVYPTTDMLYLDGDASNIKWDNLEQDYDNEHKRSRKLASNNETGFAGVSKHKPSNTYHAYIGVGNQRVYLGSRVTKQEAFALRCNAEKLLGYHNR